MFCAGCNTLKNRASPELTDRHVHYYAPCQLLMFRLSSSQLSVVMESASLIVYTGVITFVFIYVTKLLAKTSHNAQLPPGPRGLPLVGNVLDLPRAGEFEAHQWAKHKDLYGMINQSP